MSGNACHNTARLVDFEPLTTSRSAVFAIVFRLYCRVAWHYAGFTAAHANDSVALFEWTGPIILGRNDNFSFWIGESVLFIDDDANESLRELIGPIVNVQNALYDNPPFSIDVQELLPGRIVIEYRRQANRIESQFLHIILRDEQLALAVLQDTVGIIFNPTMSFLKGAGGTGPCRIACGTLGIDSPRGHNLRRVRRPAEQDTAQSSYEKCTHRFSPTYYALEDTSRKQAFALTTRS